MWVSTPWRPSQDSKTAGCPDIEGTHQVMKEAIGEAVKVADAKGIKLPFPDPVEKGSGSMSRHCRQYCVHAAGCMAQRATEIRFINGAIVSEGQRLNIETPVNFTLSSG
jgi:2-dehydropantoate 2-reductase